MDLQQLNKEKCKLVVSYAESRQGGRAENQDNYGDAVTPFGYLVTVCDGMGGGPGGRTASTIAVQEIIVGVKEAPEDETISNIVVKAIRRANMAIIEAGKTTPSLQGMGSTTTVVLINEKAAYVAHVGDSRVYLFRGKKKVFRTFDHSMVFGLVKQGVINEEQARLSDQSNIITRALGIRPDVEVDIEEIPYLKGDRFMLTSDGIHGSVDEDTLIKWATQHKPLGQITDEIATRVDDIGYKTGGGHDNLTIAFVELQKDSKQKVKMSKRIQIIFFALVLICAVSLVFNVIHLTSSSEPSTEVVDSLQKRINKLQEDSVKLAGELKTANDKAMKDTKEIVKNSIDKK